MIKINNEIRQGRPLKGLQTCETGTSQQVSQLMLAGRRRWWWW